jgi:hypothetical protein
MESFLPKLARKVVVLERKTLILSVITKPLKRLQRKLHTTRRVVFAFLAGFLVILIPATYFVFHQPAKVAAWMDSASQYRQSITVTNGGSALTDYQISFTMDTATLITAGKMRNDCYDIRVTDYNGKQIPYWVETGVNGCNTAQTRIWTKIPSIPTPNNVLYVYYGNPQAVNGQSPKSVFQFFDDFSAATVGNSANWSSSGTPTASNGEASLSNGATIVSKTAVTDSSGLGQVIVRAKEGATSLAGGKIGLSDAAAPATNFSNNNAVSLVMGSTEEQIAQTGGTNLVSDYPFEETTSTDANQFNPSGYLDTGKLNQAVSMYGNAAGTVGSRLSVPLGAQISGNNYEHWNPNQGTVSFWVKPNWNGNDGLDHYFYSRSYYGSDMQILKNSSNNLFVYMRYTNSTVRGVSVNASSWTSGNWYLISVRWNSLNPVSGSNYIEVYVNNSLAGSYTSGWAAPTPFANGYIGARRYAGDSTDGTGLANALIDDFAIFDRPLSTTEISSIYNSGTGNEAGIVADPSLKFYAKMDGSGTLQPVTYNLGASASKLTATSSELTGGINLISNGNMESASSGSPTGWTVDGGVTAADAETANIFADARSQKLTTSGNAQGILQTITVTPSTNYTLSGWLKSDGTNAVGIGLYDNNNSNYIVNMASGSGASITSSNWTYISYAFVTPSNCNSINILVRTNTAVASVFYTDNISIVPNLVTNGGMEGTYSGGLAPGWLSYVTGGTPTLAQESTIIHSGSASQKVVADTSNEGVRSTLYSVTGGQNYLVTYWLYISSGAVRTNIYFGGNPDKQIITSTTGSWQKVSWVINASASTTGGQVLLGSYNAAATFYLDDVSVIPLDNVATSFQAWTPVMDNPGANATELLTNNGFETYTGTPDNNISDSFTGWTVWSTSDPTKTVEATTTTNNGSSAVKITSDGTANPTIYSGNITVTSGNTYRISYYTRGNGTVDGKVGIWDSTNSAYIWNTATGITGTTYQQQIRYFTVPSTSTAIAVYLRANATGTAYFDDVSVKLSPTNPLSVQGALTGVTSTTSGARNNAYTFDGSTGYLRQKTYAVNIGALSYSGNTLIDSGQTFTTYKSATSPANAPYMIVVTNADNTTSWGYIGNAGERATAVTVYTDKATTSVGWNGQSVTGETPVGYEVRKTDFQITGNLTVGAWVKATWPTNRYIISKFSVPTGSDYRAYGLITGSIVKRPSFTVRSGTTSYAATATADVLTDGQWAYIVGVYVPSNSVTLYVNGIQVNQNTTSIPALLNDINMPLTIGALSDGAASSQINGSIDSPFVLNTALTASQVQDIYNSTASHYGLVTNLTAANTQPTNSATPTLDANTYHTYTISNTGASSILTQDNTTIATSTTTLPNSSMYLRMQNADTTNALTIDWVAATKLASTQPTVSGPVNEEKSDLPIAYWKFDEGQGTVAHDGSSNRADGTVNGATWQTDDMCVTGKCLYFNGSSASVDVTSKQPINMSTNNFTVSGWFRTGTYPAAYTAIVDKRLYSGSNWLGYAVTIDTSAKLAASLFYNSGTSATTITSNTALNDNKWHYFSAIYNRSGNISMYIDGQLQSNTASISSYSALDVSTTSNLEIGKKSDSNSAYVNFTGYLDDIKLYNYARTATQAKSDYNAGKAKAASAKGSTATLGNPSSATSALSNGLVGYWKMDDNVSGDAQTLVDSSGNSNNATTHYGANATGMDCTVAGKYSYGCSFDGGDDYASIADNDILDMKTGSYTISAWMKSSTTASNNDAIFSKGGQLSTALGLYTSLRSADGKIQLLLSDGSSYIVNTASTAVVGDNTWHLITEIWNPNKGINLYIDGSLDKSIAATSAVNFNTTAPLLFGGWTSASYTLNGSLDDVRIYNRALSANDVMALYKWTSYPKAEYMLDEGTGTSAYDTSGNGNTATLGTGATWTNGKYGKAVSFDGLTGTMTAPTSTTLSQTTSMSLSAFINPQKIGTNYVSGTVAKKGANYDLRFEADSQGNARTAFNTNAITTQLSGTAITDIYFYDTTKDSASTSWRFDNTKSWYTETINHPYSTCNIATDTRCGTQYFPEKAYIVATASNVYIFDAQENAMWMKFSSNGGASGASYLLYAFSGNTITSTYMLNGKLYVGVGQSTGGALDEIDFTGDSGHFLIDANNGYVWPTNIANRNTSQAFTTGGYVNLVSRQVNDVYAAVISGKTYVAVATDGGVSVVNETAGTVVNGTYNSWVVRSTVIAPNGTLYFSMGPNASTQVYIWGKYSINAVVSDWNARTASSFIYAVSGSAISPSLSLGNGTNISSIFVTGGTSTVDGVSNTVYVATSTNGVSILQEKQGDEANGSVKYYTKDYITEEMVGDIRGMWPLNGSGSIANNTDISDASVKTTTMTASNANGTGMTYATGVRGTGITFDGTDDYLKQKVYLTGAQTEINTTNGSADITLTGLTTYQTATQPYAYMIVSTNCTTTGWGYLGATISGDQTKIFSTKTGTTQNWVTVPSGGTCNTFEVRKTDFQITGNMTVGAWVKTTSGLYISKYNGTDITSSSYVLYASSGKLRFRTAPNWTDVTGNTPITDNNWHFVVGVYNGSTQSVYVDGVLDATPVAKSNGIVDGYHPLLIDYNESNYASGTIDEPFITASALTANEIKHLYDVGNRARLAGGTNTLNGSSNQVNAVIASGMERFANASNAAMSAPARLFAGTQGGGVSEIDLGSDTLINSYTTSTTPAINSNNVVSLTATPGGTFVAAMDSGASILNSVSGRTSPPANAWTQVEATYDKSAGYYYLYENGAEVGRVNVGTTFTPVTNSTAFTIGATTNTGSYAYNFYGKIDQVQLFGETQNSKSATANLNAGHPSVGSPVGSPILYYKFDEGYGTTANNAGNGGSADNGTISNATWTNDGKFGKALSFNGTNNIVTVANPTTFDFVTSDFTLSAWVNPAATQSSGTGRIIDKLKTVSGTSSYFMGVNASGNPEYWLSDGTTTVDRRYAGKDVRNGWHQLVVTYSRGNLAKLYIDGTNVDSVSIASVGDLISYNGMIIGNVGSGSPNNFNGTVDEVKIYNYALTSDEVQTDYNHSSSVVFGGQDPRDTDSTPSSLTNGLVGYWKMDDKVSGNNQTLVDSSGNGNNATTSNGANGTGMDCTVAGKYSYGCSFDGVDDYTSITTTNIINPSAGSVAMWFNPASVQTGALHYLFGAPNTSQNSRIYLWVANGGNAISGLLGNGTVIGNVTITPSTWHHVLISWQGTKAHLYVDGYEGTTTGTFNGLAASTTTSYIGNTASADQGYNGLVDDVRIYNRTLSNQEVAQLASWGPSMIGEWKFDEGTGQYVNDTSGNGNVGTLGASSSVGTDDPTWSIGKFGKGLKFNGTSSYVNIPTGTALGRNFTMSAWIKLTSLPSVVQTAVIKAISNINSYAILEMDTTPKLVYELRDDSDANGGHAAGGGGTGATLSLNKWYHIALTIDRTTNKATIYLNGIQNSVKDISAAPLPVQSYVNLIGKHIGYFPGYIDEVQVYNYARTPAQIAWDYNHGGPIAWYKMDECQGSTIHDSSGNAFDGTLNLGASGQTTAGNCYTNASTPWYTGAAGVFNSSLNFDATDDYVDIPDSTSLAPSTLSLSAWIAWDGTRYSAASTKNWAAVISKGSSSTGEYTLLMNRDSANSTNQLSFYVNGSQAATYTPTLDTKWHYVTAVYDGTNAYIYLDGQLKNTTAYTATISHASNTLRIGEQSTGTAYPWGGQIDDARVYGYPLTASQVAVIYNQGGAVRFSLPTTTAYLLNDQFITPVAAGSVNGTQAEPIGGMRTVVDTQNLLSITGGQLSFSGGKTTPSWFDPLLAWPSTTRSTGKVLLGQINNTSGALSFGWGTSATIYPNREAFSISGTTVMASQNDTITPTVGTISTSTQYSYALVLRTSGAFYFIKGGTQYPNWTLLYPGSLSTSTPLYPVIQNYNGIYTADNLKIPTNLWLPTPLAYDTFSTSSGLTENLGPDSQTAPQLTWTGGTKSGGVMSVTPTLGNEANGDVGFDSPAYWSANTGVAVTGSQAVFSNVLNGQGLSSASNILSANSWYQTKFDIISSTSGKVYLWPRIGAVDYSTVANNQIGTGRTDATTLKPYIVSHQNGTTMTFDNFSVKPLTLSSLFATVPTSTSNVIADVTIPAYTTGTQAGLVIGLDNVTTPTKFLIAYLNGNGQAEVDQDLNGTYSTIVTAGTAAWNASYVLRVVKDGTAVSLYYNNALIGTGTCDSSITGTNHGVFSTYSGDTFDNFTVWPRGTGNEFNALNQF